MKKVLMVAVTILMAQTVVRAAPFKQGDLVIYRIGDGTSILTNAGNYAFLDELTTNGTLVQSIALPQNGFIDANGGTNFPIQNSGAATSEGLMTLSVDGRYLVFSGYGTNDGWKTSNGGIQLPTSTTVPRVIGRADWLGNINTTTWSLNFLNGSGGNPRGVASTDGSNFWITSSTEGVGYAPLGSNDFAVLQANNNR